MKFRTFAGAVTAVAALGLSACGSAAQHAQPTAPVAEKTESAAQAPDTLTHAEFVTQLDALCKRWNRETDTDRADHARWKQAAAREDTAVMAQMLERQLEDGDEWRANVEQLDAPPEDSAPFARYESHNRSLDAIGAKMANALRARDLPEVERLVGILDDVRAKRTEVATSLGLVECGS